MLILGVGLVGLAGGAVAVTASRRRSTAASRRNDRKR
jgi:hypothetical protein